MSVPSGPVTKACSESVAGFRTSHYLPAVIDSGNRTAGSAKSAEVSHAYAIRTGDESLRRIIGHICLDRYLGGIINVGGNTVISAEKTEIFRAYTIRAGYESTRITTFAVEDPPATCPASLIP
jgi:hypothetical protein